MQRQTPKLPLILAGAAVLIVAALLIVHGIHQAREAEMQRAALQAAKLEAERAEAARRATEIAALQKHLAELNLAYDAAMKKAYLLRQQLLESHKGPQTKDLAAARSAVEDALDHHPAVVAMQQQLDTANKKSAELSQQQAVVLTQLHTVWDQRQQDANQGVLERFRDSAKARDAYLAKVGKKSLLLLTKEEQAAWDAIWHTYSTNIDTFAENQAARKPDAAEQQMQQEFEALGAQRAAIDKHYTEVFYQTPVVRARVRADDLTIAALDRTLSEKQTQALASVDSDPALAALQQQVNLLDRQRIDLQTQIRKLRSPSIAAPVKAQPGRTNG